MARLANLKTVSGQLRAAFELCRENRSWVERHGIWRFYISGNLKIAQADVLREWNRLEEADQLVREGIAENQAWRIPSALVYGYHVHSQIRLAQGDLDAALELVHQIESSLQSVHIHYDIFSLFDAGRVKIWLAAERLVEAARWTEQALARMDLLNDPLDYAHQLKRITLAQVWVAQGRLANGFLQNTLVPVMTLHFPIVWIR
jgi:LuxR family maltose regulon positive regulatory protein